ncbi:ATP-binding protein [Streptomyces huiliensis]|uniref:ATP-binding protein n=1 Tax=Streptomyces huiliensis TaxID=2876027 RepID=UPI001CBBE710|nr:AAA family ATPase [Streptomyces huiliensis]MBZ4320919.1 AAA family ATPase [Streptomyces huiliensis]
MLVGREREQSELAAVIAAVREGRSDCLVLRGPAGIGKSVLLDHAAEQAGSGVRVLRAIGVESEAELPYAALHQILRPLTAGEADLPAPQAAALRSAFGMDTAPADRFLVALAALALLSESSRSRPLLLLVDDAQWLDTPSSDALQFVARRLGAEGVAVIFAVRDAATGGSPAFPAPGVRELRVGPLEPDAARALLARRLPTAAAATRERVLNEANGNPLALVELPAALSPGQVSGEAVLPDELPLTERLQQLFRHRAADLLAQPGNALLLAAAEHNGDLAVVLRAAERTDRAMDELCAAAARGLLHLDQHHIRFSHPLVRSALYQGAPLNERRAAHLALASATGAGDDRHTWHLAAAAVGFDDHSAGLLTRLADRTRCTGGVATAAKALRRAAALASDPGTRARLLTDAAECAWQAAEPQQAEALLGQAEPLAGTPRLRAGVLRVRGAIVHASDDPAAACAMLLESARLIRTTDPYLAGESLVMAARSAWIADLPERLGGIAELLDGLAGDRPACDARRFADHMRHVGSLAEPAAPGGRPGDGADTPVAWLGPAHPRPWAWPPVFLPHLLGSTEPVLEALQSAADTLRKGGAIGTLPMTLAPLASLQLLTGAWPAASANATEGLDLALATGQTGPAGHLRATLAWIAAAQGDGERCRELAAASLDVTVPRRVRSAVALAHWALALDALADHRPHDAVRLLAEVCTTGGSARHYMMRQLALPDYVEACVRADETARARAALDDVPLPAHLRSAQHRCLALVATGNEAEKRFLAALDQAGPSAFETGRCHLLYGEWLRRNRRIKHARDHLLRAEEQLTAVGAAPWAEQARAELRAAGGRTTRSAPPASPAAEGLTARELQVLRLAAEGLSNSEIAARLFVSPRTVGYHLYKVFPKLGVTSRGQLYGRSFG